MTKGGFIIVGSGRNSPLKTSIEELVREGQVIVVDTPIEETTDTAKWLESFKTLKIMPSSQPTYEPFYRGIEKKKSIVKDVDKDDFLPLGVEVSGAEGLNKIFKIKYVKGCIGVASTTFVTIDHITISEVWL